MLPKIVTTILFLALHVVVFVGGLAVIFYAAPKKDEIWLAIGTGLVVTGVGGVILFMIRLIDDILTHRGSDSAQGQMAELTWELNELGKRIEHLSDYTLVRSDSEVRCVFDRHVTDPVGRAIARTRANRELSIDVVGFSLWRFYHEQMANIRTKRKFSLRIIVQDPTVPSFHQLVEQEGRNEAEMREEALQLTEQVLGWPTKHATQDQKIEIRWFPYAATITLVRLNTEFWVRPRVFKEGRDVPVFYEHYAQNDPRCSAILKDHFVMMWDASRIPKADEILKERELHPRIPLPSPTTSQK